MTGEHLHQLRCFLDDYNAACVLSCPLLTSSGRRQLESCLLFPVLAAVARQQLSNHSFCPLSPLVFPPPVVQLLCLKVIPLSLPHLCPFSHGDRKYVDNRKLRKTQTKRVLLWSIEIQPTSVGVNVVKCNVAKSNELRFAVL